MFYNVLLLDKYHMYYKQVPVKSTAHKQLPNQSVPLSKSAPPLRLPKAFVSVSKVKDDASSKAIWVTNHLLVVALNQRLRVHHHVSFTIALYICLHYKGMQTS